MVDKPRIREITETKYIGEFIGLETIEHEFKKFTICKKFINKLSNEYILSRLIDEKFNEIVIDNLLSYIEKYFSKYFSHASRTESTSEYFNFEIGVNDDGIITGISYYGDDLNEQMIIKMINKNIYNMRGMEDDIENNEVLNNYLKKMKIVITKLECDKPIMDIDKEYYEYYQIEANNNLKMMEYHKKMAKWKSDLDFYNCGLDKICSDRQRRLKFYEYCIKNNAPNDICDYIKSDEVILNPIGVRLRKDDIKKFDYWITNYKDGNMDRLKLEKPLKPIFSKNISPITKILLNIENMNGNWLNANYYLINIKMPFNINSTQWIEYKENDKWYSGIRTISPRGDPACHILSKY